MNGKEKKKSTQGGGKLINYSCLILQNVSMEPEKSQKNVRQDRARLGGK
jgi:hypothetical protein